jgi:hypothetical protein
MAENPHYKELLQLLNQFEVEYLIVGGYAVMKYGSHVTRKISTCGYAIQRRIQSESSQRSNSSGLLWSMMG